MAQVLYERGKHIPGMTKEGERLSIVAETPGAWQPNDIVILDEQVGDEDETQQFLYRISTVPPDHTDVASPDDDIECELMALKQWKGTDVYSPSGKKWVFKSNLLTSVNRDSFNVVSGKLKNKRQCRIAFDLHAYWQRLQNPLTVGYPGGVTNSYLR